MSLSSAPSLRGRPLFRVAALMTLLSVIVTGSIGFAWAATSGDRLWVGRYNGPPGDEFDGAADVAESPDGTTLFVVGGSSGGATTSSDYATVAVDAATGARLWTRRYNGPGSGDDYATAVTVSSDGTRVYVTGTSWSSSTVGDYLTIAYDAETGSRVWARRFNGVNVSDDYARSIDVSPDGTKIIVTGGSVDITSFSLDYQWTTVAYDSAGTKLWSKSYTGPGSGNDDAFDLAVSPDGANVFVTGYGRGETSNYDYTTFAYDTSTGVKVWARRYNGPKNSLDVARSIAVSADGTKVFVTGGSYGLLSDLDYATLAYDAATGARLWLKRYNGPGNSQDGASGVTVNADGTQVFVTGSSIGSASSNDYATMGYDASSGSKVWGARYNGPGNGDDNAWSVAVTSDGTRVFVTGGSPGSTSSLDYATVAYDGLTGAVLWAKRYNGSGNSDDEAHAAVVGPAGEAVFVTGYSVGSTSGGDFTTIAYAV